MNGLRIQTVSIGVIAVLSLGTLWKVLQLHNPQPAAQVQLSSVPLGLASANPNPFRCSDLSASTPCKFGVTVKADPVDDLSCAVSVYLDGDTAKKVVDIIYANTASQDIEWDLDSSVDPTKYHFEKRVVPTKRNYVGVEILDGGNDFNPTTVTSTDTNQTHVKTNLKSDTHTKTYAYAYSVYIEYNDPISTHWQRCGKFDPIIVNRD